MTRDSGEGGGAEASPSFRKMALAAAAFGLLACAALLLLRDVVHARAGVIAAACLVLWLSELVPPFVPTLLLLVATPLMLGRVDPSYGLAAVLTWSADPVLALFLGGFSLAAAAHRHGLDAMVARQIVRWSKNRRRTMVGLVLGGTALMSMWMSNIAAAALMLTALSPVLVNAANDGRFRTAILLSIAMGGNLGGMATPIGTGPNAIAISAASSHQAISFVTWMAFGVPLALGMLVLAYGILIVRFQIGGSFVANTALPTHTHGASRWVIAIAALAVAGWLSEPLHGVSAPLIALGVAVLLFGTGLLTKQDFGRLDWATLCLIAGGICVGRLLEQAGILDHLAQQMAWTEYPRVVLLGVLVLAGALLSALMSNTGTAAMLIPLAMSILPNPTTAVVVAMATSFGVLFVISTPPNAMAYSKGGVTAMDLLALGLPIMLIGCIVVTLTGEPVLKWFGLR